MTEQLHLELGPLGSAARTLVEARQPIDQDQRDRIAQDLDTTLFVEAGAGSGKTTALVSRITGLVDAGIALENIAAITFTEKAASELRQRVREALERRLAESPADHIQEALHQLDASAISTLHAFAQRVLFEHPIEAGLPPGVEVLDELSSQVYFEERWEAYLPSLLADPAFAGALLAADVLGIRPDALKALAQQFEQNWDLLETRLQPGPAELQVDLSNAVAAMTQVVQARPEASNGADKMVELLDDVARYCAHLEHLSASTQDPVDRIVDIAEALSAPHPRFGTESGTVFKQKGAVANWPSRERLDEVKEQLFAAGQVRDAARDSLTAQVIEQLASAIGGFILDGVAQRRSEGRLRFHDLLVLARGVLADPESGPRVRSALRDRYQRLLIDEFQDSDPIQVQLATLIAAEDTDAEDWEDAHVTPGRLFFVGDPKQSIYRFRRADIATYLTAQQVFGGEENQVTLQANFRSTEPIISWVNRTFAQIIQPVEDSQPAYTALVASRQRCSTGPGVAVMGATAHPGRLRANELRAAEADDVVHAITEAISQGWTVLDNNASGQNIERPARLGDIAILLPARTSLPALEAALEAAHIPYRAETQSLVYATPEVRDLMMVARAVDDPTDELAAVMALRTAAFGCGDDDLLAYKQRPGSTWNHQALPEIVPQQRQSPGEPVDIVEDGLRWMAALHNERSWIPPALLLDRIVKDRRLLELGVCQGRHREVWRRLRFVIDQARAWTDATGGDLRDYLGWVRLQGSDSARVAESVLPETDTDAVRILTVHASKGLEFPITIVSGLTTQMRSQPGSVQVVWPPGDKIGYKLGSANTTPEYDNFVPVDEQMDAHERLRLLYVACTRARDHLVVSMHRPAEGTSATLAHVIANANGGMGAHQIQPQRDGLPELTTTETDIELLDHQTWQRQRDHAVEAAQRSHSVAATTIAKLQATDDADPGLAKGSRDLDLPPWQKGRYGTAVGRAVHGVLQTIDLATGDGLDPAVRAQAAAEGIIGQEAVIAQLALSALDTDIVADAANAAHWREIYVATPLGDRVLEGYVDLLYDRGDGLVVVDHKTDAWDDESSLNDKVLRYRLQAASYAVAVEAATGRTVVDAVLLFLSPSGATARPVPELRDAMADVVGLIPNVVAGGEANTTD